MISLLVHLLRLLPFLCGGHRQLALENLALRQQLGIFKRTVARPKLRRTAAVAIEHGCEWVTNDTDFARFPGLRWRPPRQA